MRTFFSCLLIALLSFGLLVNEASAKRFGGGRSFGVQRSQSSLFSGNKSFNTASARKPIQSNKWGSMLGGMLVGGLLASLFMGHGLANGLMTWLILGSVIFFIVSFLRRKMQPGMQSAQSNAFRQSGFQQFTQPFSGNSSSYSPNTSDFDAEAFLRHAKVTFIRLQTAYDQKNLQDINSFTVPEVFAEIKMQLDELDNVPNKTEVLNLNAELLDVSKQALSKIASVRFTGSVKENNDPVTQLDEIWHFRQFDGQKDWLLGGIQQEVYQA